MLTRDVLDSQVTLELPARELMFFIGFGYRNNWAIVSQSNYATNTNIGLGNVSNLQVNQQTNIVQQG